MVDFEVYLCEINARLAGIETPGYEEPATAPSPIHVLGVPRTGTTLAIQVLATAFDLGYVDNLAAMFWSAPVFGVLASKRLLGGERLPASFRSTFGRTEGIAEPHEFGRFWKNALNYCDMVQKPIEHEERIDWNLLRLKIRNMGVAFGRPYLLKSFLLTWHLARYHRAVPESLYIRLVRPELETAASLLALRKAQEGTPEHWASLKPMACLAYDDEPWWLQIAAQIHFINSILDEGLRDVPLERILVVSFEDVRSAPDAFAERVAQWLRAFGWEIPLRRTIGQLASDRKAESLHSSEEMTLLRRGISQMAASGHD